MSQINIINKVIKENSKNNLLKQNIKKNVQLENLIDEDENNSFSQLLSLQLLIQKHSGLKELCKKNS